MSKPKPVSGYKSVAAYQASIPRKSTEQLRKDLKDLTGKHNAFTRDSLEKVKAELARRQGQ
jgi:hypothetical protein